MGKLGKIKMKRYYNHFKVVVKHKYYVGIECFKLGMYWQGIVHDFSKFSLTEFVESAKYFQGTGTPINEIKRINGYSSAWLHHSGRNKHHWQYWTDFYDGAIMPIAIPEKYLKEMACDMIGASKSYLGSNYNRSEPVKYLNEHSSEWLMRPEDLIKLKLILEDILF